MENLVHYPVAGNIVEPTGLRISKAREVATVLALKSFPFVQLVECRRDGAAEIVVVDVEPEIPPTPVYDIRETERVAITFDSNDIRQPDPRALRVDFPFPPHINLHFKGEARSLCLFEEPYVEQKLRWTASWFLGGLHRWLSKTARDELHAPNQALEPLFFSTGNVLVVPAQFFVISETAVPERLVVCAGGQGVREAALVVSAPDKVRQDQDTVAFAGLIYTAAPRAHGLIQRRPRTLGDLNRYLADTSEDFIGYIRQCLLEWHSNDAVPPEHRLILLLRLPKTREEGGAVEAMDIWAFVSHDNIQTVGVDLGIWTLYDGHLAPNIPADVARIGNGTQLDLYNVVSTLTRTRAAALNGEEAPVNSAIIAVGAGALGSQLIQTLYRSGYGQWTVVDEDLFYPHNAARHFLPVGVGFPKANLLARFLEPLIDDDAITPIVADVLVPPSEELAAAYKVADTILDTSASVAVARHLVLDVSTAARRISVFLTPDGRDLVVLAESADRSITLDHVEMEYYCALLGDERLAHHLDRPAGTVRYGHGCRDTSGRIPQELVGLHAAIASRAVRSALSSADASACVWRTSEDRSVRVVPVNVSAYTETEEGEWTIVMSARLRATINNQRIGRLPNETGGVLIGAFDSQRHRVYLVDHVPAPADSVECPTAFIRGTDGLHEVFAHVQSATARQLDYVGEWHSHPKGHRTLPSKDDAVLFSWLADHRLTDGFPPFMLIAGDHTMSFYIDSLPAGDV